MVASFILPDGLVRLNLSRRVLLGGVVLIGGVGCVGSHSTGAVWAQQNLDAERTMFQLGDARRAQMAHAFEVSLADETLGDEQQRLQNQLAACPGPRQAFTPSAADRLRDTVRVRVQDDAARQQTAANEALADWYLRRAAASGDAQFCARAERALAGAAVATTTDLLGGIPVVTVARYQGATPVEADADTLSSYALHAIDAVTGAAPLPQYLAVVYGGAVTDTTAATEGESAAAKVDEAAAGYPQWEPDALYAALRGGRWP